MPAKPVKRVAIIGAGPAGAIAIDAFAQEQAFDPIRVFERREAPGGCWLADKHPHPPIADINSLSDRATVDPTSPLPSTLPAQTPKQTTPRHAETSVYPYLETNVDAAVMQFSQEPIPADRSAASIARHGPDTPFRPYQTMQRYVQSLVDRRGYQDLVSYNTTVELATKVDGEWEVVLRREGGESDYWWKENFDAVVVASGHYSVPFVPEIRGLEEFGRRWPGSVVHTKAYRGQEAFCGKRVVVVGASVSAADAAVDLLGVAKTPVVAVVKGHRPNAYFGDEAFQHPDIAQKPSISHISNRTAHFVDGSSVSDVDAFILGTGYSWTLPFLPQIPVRNNRVPDLYQHVFHQRDPTLVFIGAVAAGLTFKVYEWQSVAAARVLAGRSQLPPLAEQQKWETERIAAKGDGVPFTAVYPGFEEYFEGLRELAGEPKGAEEPGRRLPAYEPEWLEVFLRGHQRRIRAWRRSNLEAWEGMEGAGKVLARL